MSREEELGVSKSHYHRVFLILINKLLIKLTVLSLIICLKVFPFCFTKLLHTKENKIFEMLVKYFQII